MSKTFLERHEAAMADHRDDFSNSFDPSGDEAAFNALADYADELAAKLDEAQIEGYRMCIRDHDAGGNMNGAIRLASKRWGVDQFGEIEEPPYDGLPGGIAAR